MSIENKFIGTGLLEQNCKSKINESIVPEFKKPDEMCIRTYQGEKPAVSKDNTPIITTGCGLCSALIIKQGKVSVLFHIENSGLSIRQRENLKDLPKGCYIGKEIGNEKSVIGKDIIKMLEQEGDIIVNGKEVRIETDGRWYDVLYKPEENKIYVKIRGGGEDPKIVEVEGLFSNNPAEDI